MPPLSATLWLHALNALFKNRDLASSYFGGNLHFVG